MIRAVFNCLSNLSPISRRGTPKEKVICHLCLCVLSDDLYTRVKVAIELYYKCVGTPPFLKKITPGLFALLVEGINYAAELWLNKFLCRNVLISFSSSK